MTWKDDMLKNRSPLSNQNTIRSRLIYRTNSFIEFTCEEIEQSIFQRFEKQVNLHVDSLAVKFNDFALTYGALNRFSNRIARAIVAHRKDLTEPVALLFNQGVPLIATILAILKSGKFYVPLDPSNPLSRLTYMLEDSQAVLIVTDSRNLELARSMALDKRQVLNIDQLQPQLEEDNLGIPISPDASAYVYYTSGSTGRPKGVVDTQRNVLHNIMQYTNGLRICREDRLTLLQTSSFSGAVSSMFSALLNGAALFPFDLHKRTPNEIADYLIQEEITIYHSVPAIFRSFLVGDLYFPQVRVVRLEGDQASKVDVELYQQHFSRDCILVNGLGTTETGLVRRYFIDKDTHLSGGIVPVGYAVDDMEVQLLDENGQEVLPGIVGEICVRSIFLASGYWRNQELTRSAFLESSMNGYRIYHTGDLGRMHTDGCLEHLGRKDLRVKIRGQSIDVSEIEMILLELPTIREAIVISRKDKFDEECLVAYLVQKGEVTPTISGIRRYLAKTLPDAMIPSAYVFMEKLPLTINRKVDRKALPDPGPDRPHLDSAYREPTDPLQDQITHIWEEILGIQPIGIGDDFYELGGNSLLAVRMVSRVEEVCGLKVDFSVLFSATTIEQLTAALLQQQSKKTIAGLVPIKTSGSRRPFFFLHGDYITGGRFCLNLARHLNSDQPFYVLSPCGLDGQPIPRSIEAMAERHLKVLRAFCPNGPYLLGGNCNGGLIAFEIARRLVAEGQRVDLLVVIRTSVNNVRYRNWRQAIHFLNPMLRARPDAELRWFTHLRWFLDAWRDSSRREKLSMILKKIQKLASRPVRLGKKMATDLQRNDKENNRQDIRDIYWQVASEYIPEKYPGRVTVFWPRDDVEKPEDAIYWWVKVAREVELYTVPGNHLSCVTRYAQEFINLLEACLKRYTGSREYS